MIRLALFKSSLWSSRPLNDMRFFFTNRRATSPPQPYFHKIILLHPNLSIEVLNILSLISHHSIFRFQVNLTTSNEWIWTYKPPNWVRLDPNERCTLLLPTSGGLKWRWCQNCSDKALKVSNSFNPGNATIMQKPIWFSCVHT